jgi:hypothetical protein
VVPTYLCMHASKQASTRRQSNLSTTTMKALHCWRWLVRLRVRTVVPFNHSFNVTGSQPPAATQTRQQQQQQQHLPTVSQPVNQHKKTRQQRYIYTVQPFNTNNPGSLPR